MMDWWFVLPNVWELPAESSKSAIAYATREAAEADFESGSPFRIVRMRLYLDKTASEQLFGPINQALASMA